jgi:class 3 adenylate cyclase/tetratricopeptide (TPR) repeat protein
MVTTGGSVRTGTAVVLFVDQVGSTALMTELGDVAAHELRRACAALLDNAVASNDGSIVKWLGDGLAATYTSAAAALSSACDMQRAIEAHNRRAPLEQQVSIRIGISAGDVTWDDGDVFGTPVVEAARLESAAGPGTIWCSDVVKVLAGSQTPVTYSEVGELQLKGLAAPLRAWSTEWQVDTAMPPPLPDRLIVPDRTVLVGRQRETELLDRAFADAQRRGMRTVLIDGEPGVGKSRLAREFARRAHDEGALVISSRCDEGVRTPYWPFVQALRVAATWPPNCNRRGSDPDTLDRLLPSSADEASGFANDGFQLRAFEATLSWLEDLATAFPVVLVVDDIQWADAASLDLLRFGLRAGSTAPVLLVLTYRSEPNESRDLARFLTAVRAEPATTEMTLTGLDRNAVHELLEPLGAASAVDEVLASTGGNPLFLAAVADAVEADGGVGPGTIPSNVRGHVMARVTALSPGTRVLLEAAAVIGPEVEIAVLQAVLTTTSPDVEQALDQALDEALQSNLLIELPGLPIRFRFAHAIVRDTVYDAISMTRRARLHHAVGDAIEQYYAHRVHEHLDRLVYHFSRAGDPSAIDRAARYGLDAGRAALDRMAFDEARGYFEVAVEAMEQQHATATEAERCEARIALGYAQRRCRDRRARSTLLAASDRAAALGEKELVIEAALANSPTWADNESDPVRALAYERALASLPTDDTIRRARLVAFLSVDRFLAGDPKFAELSDEALRLARLSGDASTLSDVVHYRHLTHAAPGSVFERRELAAEVRGALTDDASVWDISSWTLEAFGAALELGDVELMDSALTALRETSVRIREVNLGYHLRLMEATRAAVAGRLEEALQLSEEMLALGRAADQKTAELWYIGVRMNALFSLGRLDEMLPTLTELIAQISQSSGARSRRTLAITDVALARAHAENGRFDEARAAMAHHVDSGFSTIPLDRDWTVTMCWAARVIWQMGDADVARTLVDLLEPYRELYASNVTSWVGSVDAHCGLLYATLGEPEEAARRLTTAIESYDAMNARAAQAMALADLGDILAEVDAGRAAAARDQARLLAGRWGVTKVAERVEEFSTTPAWRTPHD